MNKRLACTSTGEKENDPMAHGISIRTDSEQSAEQQLVACNWCTARHASDPQHLCLDHLGVLSYHACCTACEQALIADVLRRYVAPKHAPHSTHLSIITHLDTHNYKLRVLVRQWQIFSTGLLIASRQQQVYQQLQERTAALLKSTRGAAENDDT